MKLLLLICSASRILKNNRTPGFTRWCQIELRQFKTLWLANIDFNWFGGASFFVVGTFFREMGMTLGRPELWNCYPLYLAQCVFAIVPSIIKMSISFGHERGVYGFAVRHRRYLLTVTFNRSKPKQFVTLRTETSNNLAF